MRNRFRVTYEIVTPESAAQGDYSEAGFVAPGNWYTNTGNPEIELGLREALQLCCPQEDSGFWFSEVDGRHNYRTGAEERRALHPPRNITRASYNRVARLLGV